MIPQGLFVFPQNSQWRQAKPSYGDPLDWLHTMVEVGGSRGIASQVCHLELLLLGGGPLPDADLGVVLLTWFSHEPVRMYPHSLQLMKWKRVLT